MGLHSNIELVRKFLRRRAQYWEDELTRELGSLVVALDGCIDDINLRLISSLPLLKGWLRKFTFLGSSLINA